MTRIVFTILICCYVVTGQVHWPTAAKDGFGTSTTLASKVWFTLADGVMTEVFYPRIDLPNVQSLQFQVVTGTKIENEINDTVHRLELPNPASLTFRQINRAKSGAYTITKTYITDPRRSTVLIHVDFETQINAQLHVLLDPSSNDKAALISTCGVPELKQRQCTVALGFADTSAQAGATARASLARGFAAIKREYEAGWERYVATLPRIAKHQRQFNVAAMVLKGLEDKTYRGAVIASPSTPWGGGPSGYHAVWARDLYHVATAFDAIGDRAAANRLLDYLFKVQQKPDGSFPQNTWVDGRPIGNGLQMDQVGLPLVLARQLKRNDRESWLRHIKPAADFIVQHGPRTEQDRWEEEAGYSPATIAAEIAGLASAAAVAKTNGDSAAAKKYFETANEWSRKIEQWTVTRGEGMSGYYLRITENSDPNDGAKIEINSSSLVVDERKVLDAGFLELVRLGVKPADDPLIVESLKLIDQLIKVETPYGDAWYRYNHDAYGETPSGGDYDGRHGVGRLWTLLTGERGEYDVARGDIRSARRRLDTMAGFANSGFMIPEQVWERSGTGTGSATPLAWSMAEFIRLAMNIEKRTEFHAKAQRRTQRRKERINSFASLRELCAFA